MSLGTSAPAQATVPSEGLAGLRPKYLLFGLIGLMFVFVVWKFESFLIDPKDPAWAHIDSFKWWLLLHGLTAACALILGPFQFSERLRRRFTKMHRVMGRIYVGGALLGAPVGVYIEYFEERMGGARSFTILTAMFAGLWMLTTGIALRFILQGKTALHRQWMTRSFALALVFLEGRTILGLTGLEKYMETIVWSCLVCAVPLADMILQWQESSRVRMVRERVTVSAGSTGR